MNRFRPVDLLLAICAASLIVACGDSNDPTPQVPAAPDGLIATASSTTEIDMTWTDNASNEDGFRVEQAPGGTTTFTEIGTVAANTTGFRHTGLSAETAYSYRVRAYNAAGPSEYSNIATATTHVAPPAAPSALVATAVSTAQIDLSWTDNASNEEGFRIEQAPAGTMTFTEIATVAANTTGFQHTRLSAETAYSYRVRAYNAAGPSGYSNIATTTATTPADVNDLEGTWTFEERLGFDCGLTGLVLDTVRTLLTAPGVMTFTLKGRLSDGRVMEGSGEVALGAGNTFAVSGTKTYTYANFTFRLDGQFIGSNRFSATVRITGTTIRFGTLQPGCEQPVRPGVIGNRTMSLLPTSLTIARDASGVFTVAVPADQSTSAEVTLSIASEIGIVPASVTIQPGENRVSFTVTGTDPGTAIITASLNGLSATSTLVVTP